METAEGSGGKTQPVERVLALLRSELFGEDLEYIFNGVVSEPANPSQSRDGRISLIDMNQRYGAAFEASKGRGSLFYDKNVVDSLEPSDAALEGTSGFNRSVLIQIVTYGVFITREREDIFIFASDIGKEDHSLRADKLGGLTNIGWGGHVSNARYREWVENGTIPSPFSLLEDTHINELAQEVHLKDHYQYTRDLGWVYCSASPDGITPRHLGHINLVFMRNRSALTDAAQPSEQKKSMNPRWMLLEEIARSSKQAPWTQEVVPVISYFARRNLL